jgi:hypothetical protein
MPAKSAKQEKFMRAVAHSPSFAKKVGVPMSVGREFTKAGGGEMKESKAMMKKEVSFMKKKGAPKSMIKHEMAEAGMKGMKKGGGVGASKMGAVKTAAPSRDGVAVKGKTKGTMVKMAGSTGMKKGGMAKMKYGGKC